MARKFSAKKLTEFREFFKQKRDELIDNLSKDKSANLDMDGDETDAVQGRVLSEMTNTLAVREAHTLSRVETSLEKIDDGSFGSCEECDSRIGAARLKAVIGCLLCIQCKEKEEQILKGERR